jgi:hypothetical protein
MDSKNLFFGLGSVLIIIIILSVLGVLGPKQNISQLPTQDTKEIIIHQSLPPVYYGGGYRKNIVYAPDLYRRHNMPHHRRHNMPHHRRHHN